MITCNRCGYKAANGASSCPKCGAPLFNSMESSFQPQMGGQEQSGIPAWLESLRVGERPVSPANGAAQFSAADLIEEGTLPTWMRSGRMDASGMPASDAFQSPSFSQTNLGAPPQGLNAQSLIDEKSLPSWMQEKGAPQSSQPQRGFDASSLVEQDALPDWMKSLQPQASSSSEARATSPAQPNSSPGAAPNWMQTLQPQTPAQKEPGAIPATPSSESFTPPAKGFSAADLLDERSLPSWMSQQGGGAPPRDDRPRQPNSLSPSSLIDEDALPDWMKESERTQRIVPQQPQSQSIPPSASNGTSQNSFSADQGLAASSFIDPNSLPDWLRSSAGQMGPVSSTSQRANMPNISYNAPPPHVENVRVPSRPRSNMNTDQNNAAAANAFASVLGVASNAPQLPGSVSPQQAPYGQYAPAPGPGQQNMPPPQQPGQMPAPGNPGVPPQGPAWYGSTAQANYNAGPYVPGSNVPPGAAMGPSAPGGVPPQYQYPPPSGGGMMPPPGGAASPGAQPGGKKRSLVDRLLGWLSR